jgi:hypothetical protein
MNWYKKSQYEADPEKPLRTLPKGNYSEIGHEGFFDNKNKYECEEIKLWIYDQNGLKVIDVSNDPKRYHESEFGKSRNYFPKGRYEKCKNIKKVSLSIPYRSHNFSNDDYMNMIEDLKEEFEVSENQIFRAF